MQTWGARECAIRARMENIMIFWKISWYFDILIDIWYFWYFDIFDFLVKNIKFKTLIQTCFTISKFTQYKRKIGKQRVWFLAFYASLIVKMGFYGFFIHDNFSCKHWFTKYLHTVTFCLIFCLKISDKYKISISDINRLISRQPWNRHKTKSPFMR